MERFEELAEILQEHGLSSALGLNGQMFDAAVADRQAGLGELADTMQWLAIFEPVHRVHCAFTHIITRSAWDNYAGQACALSNFVASTGPFRAYAVKRLQIDVMEKVCWCRSTRGRFCTSLNRPPNSSLVNT